MHSLQLPLTSLHHPCVFVCLYLCLYLYLHSQGQRNGLAVDEAFRHFDTDGNGFISRAELEEGLSQLGIFDDQNIVNWRAQIPAIINKFDQSGDGNFSLREFFSFLGVESYAPNIIQRMTKIFALATEKGLSFQDIFTELDEDKDGKLDAVELRKGLQKLGTFGEVSVDDAEAVVKQFDHNGDRTISLEEFIDFFSQRVKQAAADRVRKKRTQLISKFLEVLEIAEEKGVTLETIFEHFDRDKNGSLTMSEFTIGLRSIPHFKALNDGDIQGLVEVLDSDRNGDVSLKELKTFVVKNTPPPSNPAGNAVSDADFTSRMRTMMSKAEEKGHTIEDAIDRLDADGRGRVSRADLTSSLLRLPHFRDAGDGDVKRLVELLDTDRTGYVQLQSFKTFFQVLGQGQGQGQLVSRAPDRVRRPADYH